MNLNDVKVLLFAFVAFFVLLVRVDGRTRYGRKNSSSGNNTEGQAFNDIYSPFDNVNSSYSGLLNNLTLNSSSTSSHSKERDSISYDSSEYDSSYYSEETSERERKQHPKRKRETRERDDSPEAGDDDQRCGLTYNQLCCDGTLLDTSLCECRCGDPTSDNPSGTPTCVIGRGAFDDVPTLVNDIGDGDGAGGPGGSDSSTASRTITMDLMSILRTIGSTGFLIGIISCVLLICAF